MSQQWLNLVRDSGPEHQETCELVRALADYANDHGVAWPYVETLASYLRVTERTIYRRLAAAKEDGWITVRSGKGRRKRSHYTLVRERFTSVPENLTERVTENLTERVTPDPENLTPVTLKPDAGVIRTTMTPTEASSSAGEQDPLAMLVGVGIDDDVVRQSLHGIGGVAPSRLVRELLTVAIAERGHTATSVNRYLGDRMSGHPSNPMGCLIAALRDVPAHLAPAPAQAACDQCGGTGWQDPDADTLIRCSGCHPSSGQKSADEKREQAEPQALGIAMPPAAQAPPAQRHPAGRSRQERFSEGWAQRYTARVR